MHHIKTTQMSLPVHNYTRSSHITSTSDHDNVTGIKLDEIGDFVLLKVKLNGVVHFDCGVRVTNCATIMGDDMGDAPSTNCYFTDFEQLVGGFFGCDAVDCESTLDVVEKTEVFAGFFDANDIYRRYD